MSSQIKNDRKGKINAVDILFFLVFLLVIMVFVGYAFFSDSFFFSADNRGEKRNVEYTFTVESVEGVLLTDEGKLPVLSDDTFYCLDHKITLGDVVSVKGKKAERVPVGEKDGVVVYAEHPSRFTFEVTVRAEVVQQDGAFYVNGHAVRIGDAFTFTTPYFIGECRCISVEEVAGS